MDTLELLHLSLTYRASTEPQIFPGEKQARLASHQLRLLCNLKRQGRSAILETEGISPRWWALGEWDVVGTQQQLGASTSWELAVKRERGRGWWAVAAHPRTEPARVIVTGLGTGASLDSVWGESMPAGKQLHSQGMAMDATDKCVLWPKRPG